MSEVAIKRASAIWEDRVASMEGKSEDSSISLYSLSQLTGFPVDFIKKELILDDLNEAEMLSLDDLRKSMLSYLSKALPAN